MTLPLTLSESMYLIDKYRKIFLPRITLNKGAFLAQCALHEANEGRVVLANRLKVWLCLLMEKVFFCANKSKAGI